MLAPPKPSAEAASHWPRSIAVSYTHLGSAFVQLGLDYARAQLYAQRFRLSVAAFNRRAIKTYQRCGFDIVAQVTNAYFKNQFFIMTLE